MAAFRALSVPCFRMNSRVVTLPGRGGRLRPVRMGGTKGCADLLCCVPPHGRWLALEVKRPGGKGTPEQWAFLASIQRAGGVGEFVTSVEEAMAALTRAREE